MLKVGRGESILHQFCDKATQVDKGMMITNSFSNRHSLLRTALVLLLSATAYSASAQVIPSLKFGPKIAVFGTFTDTKPNYVSFSDFAVYGFSMGGYIQTRHVIGGEVRGSITRWGGDQHEESILAGPRAAMHFGHFSPYVAVLGGGGNAWVRTVPNEPGVHSIFEGTGPQMSILGGLDFHVKNRISLRIGEFSYSKIYLNDRTLSPLSASAGVVYRVNWPKLGGR